ncbi:MAG TPA: hypothetical protein GX497_11370 [Bacillus bacterium]|nr:hypothetical protein [Bacillus sp. (in: firmicutes)]
MIRNLFLVLFLFMVNITLVSASTLPLIQSIELTSEIDDGGEPTTLTLNEAYFDTNQRVVAQAGKKMYISVSAPRAIEVKATVKLPDGIEQLHDFTKAFNNEWTLELIPLDSQTGVWSIVKISAMDSTNQVEEITPDSLQFYVLPSQYQQFATKYLSPENQIIKTTFTKEMDPSTINKQSVSLIESTMGAVPKFHMLSDFTIQMSADHRKAYIVKENPYEDNKNYVAVFHDSVADTEGNKLGNPLYVFITGIAQIQSIDDVTVTVKQNTPYIMPKTVMGKAANGVLWPVNVTWEPTTVDTSTLGEKIATGTVQGYNGTVQLKVKVVADWLPPVHDGSLKNTLNDPNLAQAVASWLGKTVDDKVTVDDINAQLAKTYNSIDFSQRGISDLGGFSNVFANTNIASIDLSGNSITTFADYSYYEHLRSINLKNNKLQVFDIMSKPALTHLDVSDNDLTNFRVDTGSLNWLDLSKNKLTSFDATNMKDLTHLNLSKNNIRTFTWGQLDQLQQLDVSFNQLTSLEANEMTNLRALFVQDNQLTSLSLPVTHIGLISALNVQNNQLTAFPTNIEKQSYLRIFSIFNNKIDFGQYQSIDDYLKNQLGSNYYTTMPLSN